MAPFMVASILVFLVVSACPGLAQGQDTTRPFTKSGTKSAPQGSPQAPTVDANVDDVNATAPTDIRSNYLKRFPFANDASNDDGQGQSREASPGTPQLKMIAPLKRLCIEDNKMFGGEATKQFGYTCIHFQQDAAGGVATLPSQTAAAGAFSQNGQIQTFGYPMSDTMFQVIDRENRQRLLELMFDPQRRTWQETTKGHMQAASAANSTAAGAETSFNTAFAVVNETLINVANERSAVPTSGSTQAGNESFGQAVYIVQQMYKTVFLPMALLLLMPGAVMTQVKGMISGAFLGGGEDSASPFTGIMRAIIAIFLIPATQLIVSYCIDVGNALAWEVRDPAKKFIDERVLKDWASEQTFNPPLGNVKNAMKLGGDVASQQGQGQQQGGAPAAGQPGQPGAGQPGAGPGGPGQGGGSQGPGVSVGTGGVGITGGGSGPFDGSTTFGQLGNIAVGFFFPFFPTEQPPVSEEGFLPGEGKAAGQEENEVTKEDQKWLSSVMQVGFNTAAMFMGDALTVLGAYQIVFMCYLFLMGPIAAAFYAWPSGIGTLFKNVFNKWLDAVVVLALWRFWWCVILAVMTQRILYLKPDKGDPAEMMVYNCFLVLLLYVPFQPFSFHPGPIISKVLEKASSGGGGGGGGGGGAPTGGGQTAPGTATPSQAPGTPSGQQPGGQQAPGGQQSQEGAPAGGDKGSEGGTGTEGGQPGGDQSSSPGSGSGPPPSEGKPASGGSPPPPPPPPPPVSSPPAAAPPAGSSGTGSAPTSAPPAAAPVQGVANSLRSEFGGSNVQPAAPNSPPTVALAPQGAPQIIVNTGNAGQARAGYQAMRSMAPSPSYLRGAEGVTPKGGGPPAAGAGAGGGAPGATPTPGATNIHTHVHVTATGGGAPQQPSGGGTGQGAPSSAPGPSSPSGPASPTPGQSPPPGSSSPPPAPDMPPPPPARPPSNS